MHNYMKLAILFLSLTLKSVFSQQQKHHDECSMHGFAHHGPTIRFPFRLTSKPEHCGYPGFELLRNEKNQTLLELQSSVKLVVKKIDYKLHEIHVTNFEDQCLQEKFRNLTFSGSVFKFKSEHLSDYTLFNCSSLDTKLGDLIPCLSASPSYQVWAVSSYGDIEYWDLTSCIKMYNISGLPDDAYESDTLHLTWAESICGNCSLHGQSCRWKNATRHQTECYDDGSKGHAKKERLEISGGVLSLFLFVLLVSVFYYVYRSDKLDKQNNVKIENFLEDYKAQKPTRYSYADIKRITNQFKDKLGQGGYGTVYKGQLSDDVFVAVKVLNNSTGKGEEFINEVSTMGKIHHVNVVRLVGYCADGFRRALVFEYLPNDSLEKFISSEDKDVRFLGWGKLQEIALGTAKGIEYLHQGCDQRILHFDIKPHNILLDQNFIPKVSDFGQSKLCSKEQSIVSMTAARGTMGYIAPEVFSRNFGSVSYKSDVYSFGMLLLEMVGGKERVKVTVENTSQMYFPEWIYNRLDQGEELGIQIEDGELASIAKKLTVVGLWCIQWYPVDRPSMKVVVQMLEGDDKLIMPPNPFVSANALKKNSTILGRAFNGLEAISESE